jgi:hypothetical protein
MLLTGGWNITYQLVSELIGRFRLPTSKIAPSSASSSPPVAPGAAFTVHPDRLKGRQLYSGDLIIRWQN